jgi:hypothetical protein
MSASYETGLATNDDIPAIMAMQDVNLHETGGGLSVRQTTDWFRRTMLEMAIVVVRRDGLVFGYALATSIAAKSHVAARLPSAAKLLSLRSRLCRRKRTRKWARRNDVPRDPQSPARSYSDVVRKIGQHPANRKVGKMELGKFIHDGETYIVF